MAVIRRLLAILRIAVKSADYTQADVAVLLRTSISTRVPFCALAVRNLQEIDINLLNTRQALKNAL